MSFDMKYKLPTPKEIKERYPISEEAARKKIEFDFEIKKVFEGKSNKFLVIMGPCSADNEDAVCDYVKRLKRVQEETKDVLILIPRVYTNKPRTTGEGYKGIIHQPDPEKAPDLLKGLIAVRKMQSHIMEAFQMPIADEMLYPENYRYMSDVLSYVTIGARSVENQQHRLVASGVQVPVGMKNPTGGNLSVMMNSLVAAQQGHNFIYRGWDTTTSGNPYAHGILRGSTNKQGHAIANYHYEDLMLLYHLYRERDLKNPAVIVDTNHANSNKNHEEQVRIAKEVMHSRKQAKEVGALVKGLMIESYLVGGSQKIGEHVYGKSITDPCLGWEVSKKLIYEIAERV